MPGGDVDVRRYAEARAEVERPTVVLVSTDAGGVETVCRGRDPGRPVGECEPVTGGLDPGCSVVEGTATFEERRTSRPRLEPCGHVVLVLPGTLCRGHRLGPSCCGLLGAAAERVEGRRYRGLVRLGVAGRLREPVECVPDPGVGGLDLGLDLAASGGELVRGPVVDLGPEEGLQELPAVLTRGTEEPGELALRQHDRLQELRTVESDDPCDLEPDLGDA